MYHDVTGCAEGRTAIDIDHIIGFEDEALATGHHKAILQLEGEGLGNDIALLGRQRVEDATADIYLGEGCLVAQTSCHDDEILDGGVVSIGEGTWFHDLTCNGKGAFCLTLCLCRDGQNVLIAQGYIRSRTCHDGRQVERLGLKSTIGLHARQHGTRGKGFFFQTACSLHQGTNRGNLLAQFILAGTEDSSLDLHHVLITVKHRFNTYRVAISHLKAGHIKLLDGMNRITLARLTGEAHGLLISIAGEATSIFQYLCNRFRGAHLIEHRTLDMTTNVNQSIVGTYDNHIVLLQADIA